MFSLLPDDIIFYRNAPIFYKTATNKFHNYDCTISFIVKWKNNSMRCPLQNITSKNKSNKV